jgi:Cytochrome P460
MKKPSIILFSVLALGVALSCKKDVAPIANPEPEETTDANLYEAVKSSTGYTYYRNSDSIKASSKATAHGPWFRVRFNSIAKAALTDNGKLPVGAEFPEGSVVVKELYETQQGGLKYIAVMQKNKNHVNAAGTWLWGEYEADGKVYNGLATKGSACLGCHSSGDRDKVRLFELFP